MAESGARRRLAVRWSLVALGVILLFVLISGPTVRASVQAIREVARGADGWGPRALVYLLAAAFTFLTVFLPLPAEASALVNGVVFGSATAFGLTWTFAMVGAAASYEIGRRYGRGPARRLVGSPRLARVEQVVEGAGWPLLLALRLSPVMAFTAINWASGILSLSRPVFYWTTAVGLVPGTYVFTVVPELARDGPSSRRLVIAAVVAMVLLLGFSTMRLRVKRSAGAGKSRTKIFRMPPS